MTYNKLHENESTSQKAKKLQEKIDKSKKGYII